MRKPAEENQGCKADGVLVGGISVGMQAPLEGQGRANWTNDSSGDSAIGSPAEAMGGKLEVGRVEQDPTSWELQECVVVEVCSCQRGRPRLGSGVGAAAASVTSPVRVHTRDRGKAVAIDVGDKVGNVGVVILVVGRGHQLADSVGDGAEA